MIAILPASRTELSDCWHECHRAARCHGLVAALTALRKFVDGVPFGPAGHALVSAKSGETNGMVTLATVTLDEAELLALRGNGSEASTELGQRTWLTGLAWVRLGASEGILADCVAHLRGRMVDGAPLLLQQLVRGGLAEVVIEHQELHAMLDGTAPAELDLAWLSHLHRQLTRTDRMILRLFGAHGFRADGPGQVAYVSELLADIYAGPPYLDETS